MLSKRVLQLARSHRWSRQARLAAAASVSQLSHVSRSQFHSSRLIQAETVKVPQLAESLSEGTLKSWSKKVGDSVAADEEVATIETDKIDVTVNAPTAGKIVELLANEEDTVAVGQDLFRIEPGEGGGESSAGSEQPKSKDKTEPEDQQTEKKSESPPPAAKQSSAEKPSAQERRDPDSKATESKKQPPPPPSPPLKQAESPEPKTSSAVGSRNETRVKMSRMRVRIAERLKQSQNAAAFLTTFNEVDMSALLAFRSKYKEEILKSEEVKLGFMGLFARAACLTLKDIPVANSSIEGDEIVYHDYVDLSVAVATPKGLVTPIVRNAEAMDVVAIEREIGRLGRKARDGKLTLEDMNGGTFTISNGGVFGSLYGTPIINLPQAAVLGMHSIKDRAVVVDGQIVARPIMIIALTYDHRILDGREAVTFLVKLKQYLEDPLRMLLG